MKKITKNRPDLLAPYKKRLLGEISAIPNRRFVGTWRR